VLSSSRQKIVLLCLPQNKPKLEILVKEFFKSDIEFRINSDTETEIMILNKSEDNHAAVVKTFNEFCNFVYRQDIELAANLSIPVLHRSFDNQYIYKNIGMHKIDPTVANLLKVLATSNTNITTLHVNINNGNGIIISGNIGNNNVIENAIGITKNKYEIAKDWIVANPPIVKEITTVYYTRYKQANPKAIVINIFGKFVREVGYVCMQGTSHRYWIKSLE